MNTEALGNSKILNLLFKPAGLMMGSRVRGRIMNPLKTLQGAGIEPGQTVLEVGCGTFYLEPEGEWRTFTSFLENSLGLQVQGLKILNSGRYPGRRRR